MLRLAGREADGAILNWLAPYDVAQCLAEVDNPDADVVARIFVCPTDDADYARDARQDADLDLPDRAGLRRLPRLARPRRRAAARCTRRGPPATARAPPPRCPTTSSTTSSCTARPAECRDQVQAYADAGVKTPVMALLPTPAGAADLDLLRALGPEA